MSARFKSVMCPPPGGKFYFELNGERVEARDWFTMRGLVTALFERHGVKAVPEDAVAVYMCPDMPDWYCTEGGRKTFTMKEARTNAVPYFQKNIVPYDEMVRRLAVCRQCRQHDRNVCLTCTGNLQWIAERFQGRRRRIPDDDLSGICRAAATFESVVTAVEASELPEWSGVPDGCWRKKQ